MSTFEALLAELQTDVDRVQPKDALQYCANWFQSRLEEQRARTRDTLSQQRGISFSRELPADHYQDTPLGTAPGPSPISPFSQAPAPPRRTSLRNSVPYSPFGTLNVPGNALLEESEEHQQQSHQSGPPVFTIDGRELPPTSPLTTGSGPGPFDNFQGFDGKSPMAPGDYLHPPTSAIFARRTSVSAESIVLDGTGPEIPLPVYKKSPDQLRRIKEAIAGNFIFRDLDEEQATGVLNAMQERKTGKGEIVIRQGDVGEYFYVVEAGLLECYIRADPLPPSWLTENYTHPAAAGSSVVAPEKYTKPGHHSDYGRRVAECTPGNSFGELALMYGHPRAATVICMEPCTLWSLDRITFRTIILKAAHRRRTMYEQFLSSVTLLSSLEAEEKSKIADALESKVYGDGEAVVTQGETGDTFFFVEEGEAIATKSQEDDNGEVVEIKVGHLTKGDYFGELSLLRRAPRAATVSAVLRSNSSAPKLKVAALDASAFTRLLGPLRELMERQAGQRYGPSRR